MFARAFRLFCMLAVALLIAIPAHAAGNGLVRTKSVYSMRKTVRRLKADVAAKGIMFFAEIDQSKLAADADIKLAPSITASISK